MIIGIPRKYNRSEETTVYHEKLCPYKWRTNNLPQHVEECAFRTHRRAVNVLLLYHSRTQRLNSEIHSACTRSRLVQIHLCYHGYTMIEYCLRRWPNFNPIVAGSPWVNVIAIFNRTKLWLADAFHNFTWSKIIQNKIDKLGVNDF